MTRISVSIRVGQCCFTAEITKTVESSLFVIRGGQKIVTNMPDEESTVLLFMRPSGSFVTFFRFIRHFTHVMNFYRFISTAEIVYYFCIKKGTLSVIDCFAFIQF